jgi:hypothetical protein
MDCSECYRLKRERDLMGLACRLALNAVEDNSGGEPKQQMLLQAMANEANISLEIAMIRLKIHLGTHAQKSGAKHYAAGRGSARFSEKGD